METATKNPAAVALAKARAASLSPERRSEIARAAVNERWRKAREDQPTDPPPTGTDPTNVRSLADAARKRGRKFAPPAPATTAAAAGAKGGKARASRMTPEQRSEASRKAVQARWARVRGAVAVAMYVRSLCVRSAANDGTTYREAA